MRGAIPLSAFAVAERHPEAETSPVKATRRDAFVNEDLHVAIPTGRAERMKGRLKNSSRVLSATYFGTNVEPSARILHVLNRRFVHCSAASCRAAVSVCDQCSLISREKMERAMGFEPTTSTLARLRSTPELRPRIII